MADNRSNNVVVTVAVIVIILVAGFVLYYVLGGAREPIPVESSISETIIEVEPPAETSLSPALPAQEDGAVTDGGQDAGAMTDAAGQDSDTTSDDDGQQGDADAKPDEGQDA